MQRLTARHSVDKCKSEVSVGFLPSGLGKNPWEMRRKNYRSQRVGGQQENVASYGLMEAGGASMGLA